VLETARQLGRIPVVVVRGEQALDQTAWLKRWLAHPSMQGSVVLTAVDKRDAELGFNRVEAFTLARLTNAEGCLCCGMNSGLGDALRSLFLRVLSKRVEPIDRVVIDAVDLNVEQIALTLKHAPFLGQRYLYQATLTVVGQYVSLSEEGSSQPEQLLDFDEKSILKPI
jgi:G3E family GTPase